MKDGAPGRDRTTPGEMATLLAVPLRGLVQAYRLTLSPWLGRRCRFEPSCSQYALEALERHGAFRGSKLAARRISRCHPWGGSGYDPVPEASGRNKAFPEKVSETKLEP